MPLVFTISSLVTQVALLRHLLASRQRESFAAIETDIPGVEKLDSLESLSRHIEGEFPVAVLFHARWSEASTQALHRFSQEVLKITDASTSPGFVAARCFWIDAESEDGAESAVRYAVRKAGALQCFLGRNVRLLTVSAKGAVNGTLPDAFDDSAEEKVRLNRENVASTAVRAALHALSFGQGDLEKSLDVLDRVLGEGGLRPLSQSKSDKETYAPAASGVQWTA